MADIQDVQAQLRELRHQPASRGGGRDLTFYLVAGVAVAAGFGIVLFMPRIFSVQRTASLPVFHETVSRQTAAVKNTVAAPAVAQPADDPSGYAGKSAEEVATIADAVCARNPQARPNGAAAQENASFSADTMPYENERLYCFLSEGPARFCAAGQSRKATADIINYFKGIEYANAAAGTPARVAGVELAPPGAKLAPDWCVIVAVEGLVKAGYLSRAQREEIGASVPPDIKHRFALVIANASPCPKPPWWAVWK